MNKIILTQDNIREIVADNKYKVEEKTKYISRCIDGRYENSKDLPVLAFPGADVGELALILATANSYGFEINVEKTFKSLVKVVGGENNFRLHTDSHGDKNIRASGCGHWKQINLDPKAYNLNEDQIKLIQDKLTIGQSVTLNGEHLEGAVLIVKGDYGILPQLSLYTDQGKKQVQVFVYHQTLVDERHRLLAKELIKNKAVIFKNGEDEDWLYNALSDTAENHLMETAKRLAKGLPIYSVVFKEDGSFKIEQQGIV